MCIFKAEMRSSHIELRQKSYPVLLIPIQKFQGGLARSNGTFIARLCINCLLLDVDNAPQIDQ